MAKIRVKCIDSNGGINLTVNRIYETEGDISTLYWYIYDDKGLVSGKTKIRFQIVSDPLPQVKCNTDRDIIKGYLTFNKMYDVFFENTTHYIVKDDAGMYFAWGKGFFDKVIIQQSNKQTFLAAKSIDPEEDNCWKAMRPYIAPGNCVCNIKIDRCDYHRP